MMEVPIPTFVNIWMNPEKTVMIATKPYSSGKRSLERIIVEMNSKPWDM